MNKNDETRTLEEFKKAPQSRGFLLDQTKNIDTEKRTVEMAFSSEEPYLRWFGIEILGHDPSEIDLSRMPGAPLLDGHDHTKQIGVIDSWRIDSDRRLRGTVRFSRKAKAEEDFQDVIDNIKQQVSVGYYVNEMTLVKQSEDGPDEYRVTSWTPYEASLVSVAADPTVGVGKSAQTTIVINQPQEEPQKLVEAIREEITKSPLIKESKPQEKSKMEESQVVEPQFSERDVAEAARKKERERASEIRQAGDNYGCPDLAQKYIDNGGSIDQFNQEAIEVIHKTKAIKAEDAKIGLTDKETKRFSLIKLMAALSNPQDARARNAAAFEFDVCQAAADKRQKSPEGVLIPTDVLTRSLSVAVAADGGNLVDTELMAGSFISILQNMSALYQTGATYLTGLNGDIAIPRQTGGASTYWLAESGASTESSATFDQVGLTPKTIAAHTEFSRKLLKQSSLDVEQLVQAELARVIALGLDYAGINGSGASNQPTGVRNISGIGSVVGGTNGLAPTWAHVVQLETAAANANAAVGRLAYLTNTKVRGTLKETEKFSGGGREIWEPGNELNNYPAYASNQVPSNLTKGTSVGVASSIIFGNWADLIIGMWGGLDLLVNPYSKDTTGDIRVTAFQDCDIAARHPESFAVMDDALTTT